MMTPTSSRLEGWLLTAVLFLLQACAAGSDPYRFEDGWRIATISEVGNGSTLSRPGTPSNDCRRTAAAGLASHAYAEVLFHDFRHVRTRIVLLPEHGDFREGERVYVNIRDCTVPIAAEQQMAQ